MFTGYEWCRLKRWLQIGDGRVAIFLRRGTTNLQLPITDLHSAIEQRMTDDLDRLKAALTTHRTTNPNNVS